MLAKKGKLKVATAVKITVQEIAKQGYYETKTDTVTLKAKKKKG